MHGGKMPHGPNTRAYKHGRYSKYVRGEIQQKLLDFEDKDPLDILPELMMQRVLFANYLARFQQGIVPTAGDIQAMMNWLGEIGRTVERIVKMKNDTALTAAEVTFLAARLTDVVGRYVPEPDRQLAFVNEVFAGLQTESIRTITAAASVEGQ
jgi:hypothetical protein